MFYENISSDIKYSLNFKIQSKHIGYNSSSVEITSIKYVARFSWTWIGDDHLTDH